MITVEQVSMTLISHFKAARLGALKDSPSAFGSTYSKESQLADEDWVRRVAGWNSNGSVCYVAMDDGASCGIAAGKRAEDEPQRADLLSMWVAPTHRRAGLGKRLVGAVQAWAVGAGFNELRLMVTSSNTAAIDFYQGYGFRMTGRTEPYSNDSSLFEYEMVKPIGDG